MRRILRLAIPSIAGAIADRILRLVLIGLLSYYIDTPSMVAFVLANVFVRLTTEAISGAITDTEVTNIQNAMADGGDEAFYKSGQIVQLALIVQTLIAVPVLLGWAFGIKSLVSWLLWDVAPLVAQLAEDYTQVIVLDYYFRIAGKTFLAPFQMNGRAPFETIIDVVAAVVTMIAIGVVIGIGTATTVGDRPTLVSVAWIQVIASLVKITVKVAYVSLKGWFQPYRGGFLGRVTFLVSCM
jgi:Na+-driven multidrug efflux pump